jgi:hypothetical protein
MECDLYTGIKVFFDLTSMIYNHNHTIPPQISNIAVKAGMITIKDELLIWIKVHDQKPPSQGRRLHLSTFVREDYTQCLLWSPSNAN